MLQRDSDEPCESCPEPQIYEENEEAVTLFGLASTQWRISPVGTYLGLDYPALALVARWTGRPITPTLFLQIRHIEREWIQALRQLSERENATS